MDKKLRIALYVAMLALFPFAAVAQTTHHLTFYGVATSISGTAAVGEASVDVDVDADQFFDALEMAGVVSYRAEAPKWSFVTDACFFGLGGSSGGTEMDLDMLVLELDAGYRFNPTAEVFVGVRYTDLQAQVQGNTPISGEPFDVENGDEFIDPVVGFRFSKPFAETWLVAGRGDVGGFGVDMDMQWQAKLELGWRPSEHWTLSAGYLALDQDFEDAGDGGRFAMDVTYQGPLMGLTYSF